MAIYTNTGEGGTAGVTATPANTGGASGTAFTAIFGTGPVTFQPTAKVHGDMGYRTDNALVSAHYHDFPTGVGAASFRGYFRFSGVPTADEHFIRIGNTTTRMFGAHVNSVGRIRFSDNAGTGGVITDTATIVPGSLYRTEMYCAVGTTTSNGTFHAGLFAGDSTTPIISTALTNRNTGTGTPYNRFHIGKLTASSIVIDWDSAEWRTGADATGLPGPFVAPATVGAGADQANVEPWSIVGLTATSSSGAATWSQVSGPAVTLVGSDPLTRTFVAPASFTASTLVFRATNGAATDDVQVGVLPATDGLVTSVGPIVVTPIRFTRVA